MSVIRAWMSGAGRLSASSSLASSACACLVCARPSIELSWVRRSICATIVALAAASASWRSSMPAGRPAASTTGMWRRPSRRMRATRPIEEIVRVRP